MVIRSRVLRQYKHGQQKVSRARDLNSRGSVTAGTDSLMVSPLFTSVTLGFDSSGSGRIIAGSSKPERCVGSRVAQDLITSSMYLQPYISQESFDRKHVYVLCEEIYGLMTSVDKISYGTATAAMRT